MKPARPHGFTLVEVMVVVFIIAVLLTIATPGFINARDSSHTKSCIANMKTIEAGKQQLIMRNIGINAHNLIGSDCPLKQMPICPTEQKPYNNLGNENHEVTCPSNVADHVLPN